MSNGIYSALSGAIAQQRNLDVTANNIANANTVGYRGDRVAFQQALAQTAPSPAPNSLRFAVVSQVQPNQEMGTLKQTGAALDVAIQSTGFFAVQTPQGERYTRAGTFRLDGQNILRTADGYEVQSQGGGPITFPPDARQIVITNDGTINVDNAQIGTLKVVQFEKPELLVKQGNALFMAPKEVPPTESQDPEVVQGFLEASNINAVEGMHELITVNRSFDALHRVIQTFRDIDERTAREIASRS